MRNVVLAVIACAAWGSAARAADTVVIQSPVHLDTPEQLADLRATNPNHYARATRIMVAANRLCPPGAPKVQEADLRNNSRDLSCGHAFLTSNPPKREISFTLDGTHYVALVTITASPPKSINTH
jgi:hypothetical protein